MDQDKLPPLWEVDGVATEPTQRRIARFRARTAEEAVQLAKCFGINATPENAKKVPDFEAALVLLQEASEWARHYSTVRMTVTTFLITLSAGILTFRWGSFPFAVLAFVVWVVAAFFFYMFTGPEWKELDRREENLAIIRCTSFTRKTRQEHLWEDAGTKALIGLTLIFLIGCIFSVLRFPASTEEPTLVRIVE